LVVDVGSVSGYLSTSVQIYTYSWRPDASLLITQVTAHRRGTSTIIFARE
jgi:hypothetical protein